MPFCCVAIGVLCQAERFSRFSQDGQVVVKPQVLAPDSTIFVAASAISAQVAGAFSGSRPAAVNASLL